MNAVDTNVLVYRLDHNEPVKRAKARDLLVRLRAASVPTVLPWQVIGELVRQLRSWQGQGRLGGAAVRRYVTAVRGRFPLAMPTPAALDHALDLADRYSLSHWDSMLLGTCVDAGVRVLYTEDMGSPGQYGSIRLDNPFV
jgi:predicted nucleic acid-binding protein